jgi:hypothetical protein
VAKKAAAVANASNVQVIHVPPGGTADVIVDVGPMTVPYTISYRGRTVIKSLVDRAEPLTLAAGDHILGWAFAHMAKGWSHTVGISVNGAAPITLESLSEVNKDQDHSVSFAVVRF